MRRLRTLLCVCLVTSAATSRAHAQGGSGAAVSGAGKEQAKRLFEDGVGLEKKADYAGALAKYREAEQLTVTPGLRFHKGYCLEMTGKLASALEEYDAADKLAREQNKQDVHTAILVRVDPLRARVPQLAIRVPTPAQGAEVQLDGAPIAALLLDGRAFRIDPGEHTVTAHASGYKSLTRKVQVPEAVTTTVDLSLERVAPPRPPIVPAFAEAPASSRAPEPTPSAVVDGPPREPTRKRSLALPATTTVGAAAFAGAGIAFFLVASGAQADAQRDCVTRTTCEDERSRVRMFDALALGSFVGAASLGIVSVVLWTSKRPTPSASTAAPELAPRARVLATPTVLGLEGTF